MIEIEPLRPEHLERFKPETPLDIPAEQIGKAVAYIKDGEVLGVCGGWDIGDGTAEVGLAVSERFRKFFETILDRLKPEPKQPGCRPFLLGALDVNLPVSHAPQALVEL